MPTKPTTTDPTIQPQAAAALARLQAMQAEVASMTPDELSDEVERRAALRPVAEQMDEGGLRRLARRIAGQQRHARLVAMAAAAAAARSFTRFVASLRIGPRGRQRRRQRRATRKAADPPAGSAGDPAPARKREGLPHGNATGPPLNDSKGDPEPSFTTPDRLCKVHHLSSANLGAVDTRRKRSTPKRIAPMGIVITKVAPRVEAWLRANIGEQRRLRAALTRQRKRLSGLQVEPRRPRPASSTRARRSPSSRLRRASTRKATAGPPDGAGRRHAGGGGRAGA